MVLRELHSPRREVKHSCSKMIEFHYFLRNVIEYAVFNTIENNLHKRYIALYNF